MLTTTFHITHEVMMLHSPRATTSSMVWPYTYYLMLLIFQSNFLTKVSTYIIHAFIVTPSPPQSLTKPHRQKMSSEEQHHHHFIQWHLNKLINGSSSTFHSYNQSLFLLLWFFAILIFVPSLFLCFHLCCRRFSQQQRSTSTTVVSPLPDQCVVGIEFMANHTLVPSSTSMVGAGFEKEECCICLSLFQSNEKLKVLIECEHVFHSECLDMWLSGHPSCPLCRASLHVSENLKKWCC